MHALMAARTWIVTAISIFAACGEPFADEAAPTHDEIVAAMWRWQAKLNTFAVVYAYREEMVRGAYYRTNVDRTRVVLQHFQFGRGEMAFFSGAASIGRLPARGMPPIQYMDDGVYIKWRPLSRLAREVDVRNAARSGGGLVPVCEWLEGFGFFPAKDRLPEGEEFFLPEALSENSYTIFPERENVGGVLCWRVERDGIDRLWLDPETGFTVRLRHWRPPRGRSVVYRAHNFECWDYREIVPRVWLPWMSRREVLMPTDDAPNDLTTVMVSHAIVGEVRHHAEVHRPSYLPGTIVTAQKGDDVTIARVLPGGEEILDEVVGRLTAVGSPRPIAPQRSRPTRAFGATLAFGAALAGMAIGFVARSVERRRTMGPTKPSHDNSSLPKTPEVMS